MPVTGRGRVLHPLVLSTLNWGLTNAGPFVIQQGTTYSHLLFFNTGFSQ